jgi:lysophospholipase L1-like esterase
VSDNRWPGAARWAVTAAAGAGALAGIVSVTVTALLRQGRQATRQIEDAALQAAAEQGLLGNDRLPPGYPATDLPVPDADGIRQPAVPDPDAAGLRPLRLVMMGDSLSVGYGSSSADTVPGALLAQGVADACGRPVRLITHGRSGALTSDLARQLRAALPDAPDVVVIVAGANDIRRGVAPWHSAELLGDAVAALHAQGIPVIVGTCPDYGVIEPIPQPLRQVLHLWSVRLAVLQRKTARAAGARVVVLGEQVSPSFAGHPELFSPDHFHPSGDGYRIAVQALLPSVLSAVRGEAVPVEDEPVEDDPVEHAPIVDAPFDGAALALAADLPATGTSVA